MKCKKHPKYKGKRYPYSECVSCLKIWYSPTKIEKEIGEMRTKMSESVTIPVSITRLHLETLRRRFERQMEENPHWANCPLNDELIVKLCVSESISLETKYLINKWNEKKDSVPK